jgi:hypothetical protein
MANLASSNALSVNPWQSASYSSDCATAQLSGACALLAILVQTQTTTQSGARTDIEWNAQRLDELKQQLADSIQKAKEASEHSGFLGFLGDVFGSDIAQVAGAVAAVAAMVATAGAAAPLIMIAIAESLQLAAKAGAQLGLDPKLCMALSVASVAVGLCTGTGELQAATKIAQVARDVELGANLAQGAATATGGALRYAAASYHSDSLHYQADVVLSRGHKDATNLDLYDALSMLQRAIKTAQCETSTVSSIVQDDTDTNTALSDRI